MVSDARTRILVEEKGEACPVNQAPTACSLTIFGASGDLTHRKLVPSLYYLHRNGLLPESFFISERLGRK